MSTENAQWWSDHVCGSSMARSLGLTDPTPEAMALFDLHYMAHYPYLLEYLPPRPVGFKVLEIGLGMGTMARALTAIGCDYQGVDIAPAPVEVLRAQLGKRVRVADALDLPFADKTFEAVYAIGSLHHTGDMQRGIDEVHRVLRPKGYAVIMVYNADALRRKLDPSSLKRYDGIPPHTDFVTQCGLRGMCRCFDRVNIEPQNCDAHFGVARKALLHTPIATEHGTDLYCVAVRGSE